MADVVFEKVGGERHPCAEHPIGNRSGVGTRFRHLVRLGLTLLTTLLLLNGCFLALRLADSLIDKDQIASAMRDGFEHGAMSLDPWPHNALLGRDHYSDCITAQIAVVGDKTPFKNALAPRLMSQEQAGHAALQHNACDELLQYLNGSAQPIPGVTYTRFWHGAANVLNVALLSLPFDGYRAILLDLTLGLIAATAVCAALAGKHLLTALAPLLVGSFAFDGQIGYAQLVSYGPAAIATWSVALALVHERNRMTEERMVRFAVTAGALEAFLDQMISVPLAAAVFVVVAGTITADHANGPARSLSRMSSIVVAWACGLVGSYAIKLGLSMMVLGPNALIEFAQQIAYRAGTVDTEIGLDPAASTSRLAIVGLAILRALANAWRLGYTDAPGMFCISLGLAGIAGWAFAATFLVAAWREGRAAVVLEYGAAYIAASLVVAGWFVMFPEHVLRHSFTVRASLIWVIGGWGWFLSARLASQWDRPARR